MSTIAASSCRRVLVTRDLASAFPPVAAVLEQMVSRLGVQIDQWSSPEAMPRSELLARVRGASALLCLLTDRVDRELLDEAGPDLKVVSTMSVGYDHIDVRECKQRGIRVGFTPDVLTEATSELTIGLLIAACRRFVDCAATVRDGRWGAWNPSWMLGRQIQGSTVGIIGLGRIGKSVAHKLIPFKPARILYWGPREHNLEAEDPILSKAGVTFRADFHADFLPECDHVVVTCALNDRTRHLLDRRAFSCMRPTATLVNTSRGAIVHQADLIKVLQSGTIMGAALDVTDPEPLPGDSPLLSLPNCLVLPHIGSATVQTRSAMACLAANNIMSFFKSGSLVAEVQ